MEEVWEVDLDRLTVDDVVELEEAGSGAATMRRVREILGRLVSNKTEEEIGKTSIAELRRQLDLMRGTIGDLAVPKESDAP